MKKLLYILPILFIGCTTTESEWEVMPEYIDYTLDENIMIALYTSYVNSDITSYKYLYASN